MHQATVRLVALLTFVLGDAVASWLILSLGGSFVRMDLMGAHETPFGRAIWLLLFVIMVKGSIPAAKASADRLLARGERTQAPADA